MAARTRGKGRGRVVAVIRANGGWMYVVQSFGTNNAQQPILSQLVTKDQLRGNFRKKAERWEAYLA
jgi:hypothetical protein